MQNAFVKGAKGAGAGLIYLVVSSIFGGGFWGAIAAIIAAGSMFRGEDGDDIALIAGFMLFANAAGGSSSTASADEGVM
jgi:hypothetical protein